MVNKRKPLTNVDNDVAKLAKRLAKLEKDHIGAMKMATKAIKENGLLKIEIQRLITRVNTNENQLGQFRSKR